jgi:hypothetical protein
MSSPIRSATSSRMAPVTCSTSSLPGTAACAARVDAGKGGVLAVQRT